MGVGAPAPASRWRLHRRHASVGGAWGVRDTDLSIRNGQWYNEDEEDSVPAKSNAQQQFMAICEHNQKHARGKCPSKAVAKEFSSTPTKGLPKHAGKKRRHGYAI